MSDPAPSVSVVMPTFNKASFLERTLASWTHQAATGYELVIVDDGSTDDTPAVIARYAARLPIHHTRIANAGRGPARNHGLARARGEIIVFSDDDMLISPGYVESYRRVLGAPGNVVALGWQQRLVVELRPHEPIAATALHRMFEARPALRQAIAQGQAAATITAAEVEREPGVIEPFIVDDPWFVKRALVAIAMFGDDISRCTLAWAFGTTGNMAVRRDTLAGVGGFDPRFVGWGIEDTELHYRLAKAGATTRYNRDAVSYHQNHPRDEVALMRSWWRNLRTMTAKHPGVELAVYMRLISDALTLEETEQMFAELRAHPEAPAARAAEHALHGQPGELSAGA